MLENHLKILSKTSPVNNTSNQNTRKYLDVLQNFKHITHEKFTKLIYSRYFYENILSSILYLSALIFLLLSRINHLSAMAEMKTNHSELYFHTRTHLSTPSWGNHHWVLWGICLWSGNRSQGPASPSGDSVCSELCMFWRGTKKN